VEGRLGHRDDWSFVTAGRIWLNQNWLSHLLIFQAWRLGGETGLLAWKAVLLTAMAALLFQLARKRGGDRPVAAIVSAGMVLACFRFVLLRPNLTTLVLLLLTMLLLHASFARRRLVLGAVPVMALWSNAHGGFVLGLGMVGLWMLCVAVDDWRRRGASAIRKDAWLAAVLAACVAACAFSPFGVTNLLIPTRVAAGPGWRAVPEWLPLLSNQRLPVPWEFFVVFGLVPVLGAAHWLWRPAAPRARKRAASGAPGDLAPRLFEYGLLAILTVMAFQSRRFVPLAILAAAPPLAGLLGALPRSGRRAIAIAAGAGVLLALVGTGRRNAQAYRAEHPVRRGSTTFDRMHMVSDVFPVDAARFLEQNRITGSAMAAWEWEGYLRWMHPAVRVLMGGRAQQVYPEELLERWTSIQITNEGPRLLREFRADLAILPHGPRFQRLVAGLAATGHWVCLYRDGRVLILADSLSTITRPFVHRALAGTLAYPTESSRGLSLATRLLGEAAPDTGRLLAAIREANDDRPTAQAYELLGALPVTGAFADSVTVYLEGEAARLERLQPRGRGEQEIREARIVIERVLAQRYRAAARVPDATRALSQALALEQERAAVGRTWH
jgi:hypothetical protein